MQKYERLLRLATGLVVAAYVAGHFLNHALGIVSLEAMDALRRPLAFWWRSLPGTALLYGSLATHFVLALVSLSRRRTLRMPAWEAAQLVLGLSILPLLVYHVIGTRFVWQLLGLEVNYPRIVSAIWADPWQIAKQLLLITVVWLHFCFGIHFWLRLKPWYPRAQQYLFAAAVLVPALAIVGTMGPPAAPIISAIGDTINSAARLESLTKQYGTTLVVSADTLRLAGIDLPDVPLHRAEVRGKAQLIEVLAIEDPGALLLRTEA